MESVSVTQANNKSNGVANGNHRHQATKERCDGFQMPLHYPRYTRDEYEKMPEWKIDCVLGEYGLPINGDVKYKRKFAMGAFFGLVDF